MADRERILKIRDLNISFKIEGKKVNAIRGVNLDLYKGETIAIVGESGSGKSVTTKAIMGILAKNGSIESGSIDYTWHDPDTDEKHTVDITKMTEKEIQKEIRGRKIAMVFQDPMTSLDPTMTIGKQIMEPMMYHYGTSKEEAYKKAVELLEEGKGGLCVGEVHGQITAFPITEVLSHKHVADAGIYEDAKKLR